MLLREIKEPVRQLKGVGPAAAGALARLGINTIGSLLCHYPREWEDRSRLIPLKDWALGPVNTEVTVLSQEWFGFGRAKTLKVYIEDEDTASPRFPASLVCFNRPFLERQLRPGARFKLYGQFNLKYGEIQSSAFELEPAEGGKAGSGEFIPLQGAVVPVYPLTAGMSQGQMRKLLRRALDYAAPRLEDELPESIITRDGLFHKADAMKAIHFPASLDELERAKKTLIYEELFYLEIMVCRRAIERKRRGMKADGRAAHLHTAEKAADDTPVSRRVVEKAADDGPASLRIKAAATANNDPYSPIPNPYSPLQLRLLERLPFQLTPGQDAAVREISRDMDGVFPMARLLQGDVGSGKTLVSFLAALKAAEKGGQAALMAPTELLARQHAENAARLLEPLGVRIAFLTGNIKAAGRSQLLKALAAGEVDLVAGTHALFSRDVEYRSLGLVVIDEQHRFGVIQRQTIMAKGDSPHLLMMSATPIPRSLALTVFGDLDVTVIRDMPPGRKPVKTHLAKESNEGKVYEFIRKELAAGRQAYFVYPLIDGGDDGYAKDGADLKDAVSMADRLSKEVFPGFPLALLHSKVDEDDKRRIMDAFRKGEIKILTATSVVEVGVDVPNASCMVIEHAERFGLSALHQLRGRVGRGTDQSYCFLVYSDNLTEDGKKRLMVMLENSDGFVIAEEDLKLRGPGQITGIEQSGYLKLGIADPVKDASQLELARNDAFAILEDDPALEKAVNRPIAEVLERAPPFPDAGL